MNRSIRFKLLLAAMVLPLVVAGCFSSNPTRSGDSGQTGSPGGSPSSIPGSSPSGIPDSSPTGIPDSRPSGMPGTESGSQSGAPGSPGATRGHRGVPGETSSPGPLSLPTPDSQPGQGGKGDGQSDIRVASAKTPGAAEGSSEADGTDVSGSVDGRPDVTVAEALEGANAAVDAAADAVGDAEATLERAREELESGGAGEQDNFDPWAKAGASGEQEAAEAGAAEGGEQTGTAQAPRQADAADEDDNFDPFAGYDEDDDTSERLIPRTNSLETADDALAAARAALNRARRSLIKAAGSGSGDADAEAVQLAAAQAAMEAAAEAVIASAIAVMAASDALPDDDFDADAAEAERERLAEGIAMVVSMTEREMNNAAEALEATGELLSAAGALIGILNRSGQQPDETEDSYADTAEQVAGLEKKLDRSLAVFDDRMEAEGRAIGGTAVSEDSELAGLMEGEVASTRSAQGSGYANDSRANRRDEQLGDPSVKDRYETPDVIEGSETGEFDIGEGRIQDDDIIARQLREAAMAETDPELREALWQEYKNYKEGLETGEADANP